jgi:hypothetical protein
VTGLHSLSVTKYLTVLLQESHDSSMQNISKLVAVLQWCQTYITWLSHRHGAPEGMAVNSSMQIHHAPKLQWCQGYTVCQSRSASLSSCKRATANISLMW